MKLAFSTLGCPQYTIEQAIDAANEKIYSTDSGRGDPGCVRTVPCGFSYRTPTNRENDSS